MDDLPFLTSPARADGSTPAGWPKFTHGWIFASPVIGDIDGDGKHEVVAVTREGVLFIWNTRAKAKANSVQWQGFGGDRRNSGNLGVGLGLRARGAVR